MGSTGEYRDGHYVSGEMKDLWQLQLVLLKRLLDVCRRHDLQLWLAGGSLLGAVRHHGFIPWDDDIDVVMFRKDYDELIRIAKEEFQAPFFFQTNTTDKRYFRFHSQLRYDNTSAILAEDIYQPFHQGIFIDIFVYDSIPSNPSPEWDHRVDEFFSIKQQIFVRRYFEFSIFHPKRTLRNLWFLLQGTGKVQELFRRAESIATENEGKDTTRASCFAINPGNYRKSIVCKSWFDKTEYVQFEDIVAPVPGNFHDVLVGLYGTNYMTPIKAPSYHGGFAFVSTSVPYKRALPKLKLSHICDVWLGRWEKLKNSISRSACRG